MCYLCGTAYMISVISILCDHCQLLVASQEDKICLEVLHQGLLWPRSLIDRLNGLRSRLGGFLATNFMRRTEFIGYICISKLLKIFFFFLFKMLLCGADEGIIEDGESEGEMDEVVQLALQLYEKFDRWKTRPKCVNWASKIAH